LEERSAVLSALATVLPGPGPTLATLPPSPLVWITTGSQPTPTLPPGSGQLIWGKAQLSKPSPEDQNHRWIDAQLPLINQLETDGTPLQSALLADATVEKELPQPQV
jgi:poly(3-hydroxybutyrate) depolymerase